LNVGTSITASQVTVQAQTIHVNGNINAISNSPLSAAIQLLAQALYISGRLSTSTALSNSNSNNNSNTNTNTNSNTVTYNGTLIRAEDLPTFLRAQNNSNTNLDQVYSSTAANDNSASNINTQTNSIYLQAANDITLYSTAEIKANGTTGGYVNITAQALNAQSGSLIQANGNNGPGGVINITTHDARLAGAISANGANGGSFALSANNAQFEAQSVIQTNGSSGPGGTISIDVSQNIDFVNSGLYANGTTNGGEIRILSRAGNLNLFDSVIQTNGSNGRGGSIGISAFDQTILSNATIEANGFIQGGTILLGNDAEHGTLPFSIYASFDQSTRISTLAISANGVGGFIETSAHTINLLGTINAGRGGMWLLDPIDITVTTSGSSVSSAGGTYATSGNVSASSIVAALNNGNSVVIDTTGGSGGSGDIAINSNITTGAMATDATLTFKASRNITIANGVLIDATQNSNSKKLNVILWADADNSAGGYIRVIGTSTSGIKSNGGDIYLTGGTNYLTGYAKGISGYQLGIGLEQNSIIDAAGGNITIRGQGDSSSSVTGDGIKTWDAQIKTSGTGTISLYGQGTGNWNAIILTGSSTTLYTSGSGLITVDGRPLSGANATFSGVRLDGNVKITSAAGAISIYGDNGSSGSDFGGVRLGEGGTTGGISAYGNITITGSSASSSGVYVSPANYFITSTNGTVDITGTGLHGITVYDSSDKITAYGNLTLTGTSSTTGIGLYTTMYSTGSGSGWIKSTNGNVVMNGNSLGNSIYYATYVRIPVIATNGSVTITGNGYYGGVSFEDLYNGAIQAKNDINVVGYSRNSNNGVYTTLNSISKKIVSDSGNIIFSGYAAGGTALFASGSSNVTATTGNIIFQGASLSGNFAIANSSANAQGSTYGLQWDGDLSAASGYIRIAAIKPYLAAAQTFTANGIVLLGLGSSSATIDSDGGYLYSGTSGAIASLAIDAGSNAVSISRSGDTTIAGISSYAGIVGGGVTITMADTTKLLNINGAVSASSISVTTGRIRVGSSGSITTTGAITLTPSANYPLEIYGTELKSTGSGAISLGVSGVGTYFNSASAQTISSAGGNISFSGDVLIANPAGLSVNTSGSGTITFGGRVDSGDTYTAMGLASSWSNAINGATSADLGRSVGGTFLATPTSALQNALLVYGAASQGAPALYWIGARKLCSTPAQCTGSLTNIVATPGSTTGNIWAWVVGPAANNSNSYTHFFTQGSGAVSGFYTNWVSGEPNGTNYGEYIAHIREDATGTWNDIYNSYSMNYIRQTNNALASLSVTTGSGLIRMNGAVGGLKPLAGLTINGSLTLGASADRIVTAGNQTVTGTLTTGATTTILDSQGNAANGSTIGIPATTGNGTISLGTLSSSTRNVTLYTGTATLALPSTTTAALTINSANTTSSAVTQTAAWIVSGTLTFAGNAAGVLTLSNTSNAITGTMAVNSGTLAISADTNLSAAPASATAGLLTLNGGTLRTTSTFTLHSNRGISIGSSGGTISTDSGTTLTYGGIMAGTGVFTKSGDGTLILSGNSTYSGLTTVNAGTLRFAPSSGFTMILSGGITNNSDVQYEAASTSELFFDGAVSGTGTWTVNSAANNTAFNSRMILRGTTTTSGQVTVTNYGNFWLEGSSINATSPIYLNGANTYLRVYGSAGATIKAGTITGNGTIDFSSGGGGKALSLSTGHDDGTGAFGGLISNSGVNAGPTVLSIIKAGTGTWTLSGSNTYTGVTTLSGGTLSVSALANGGSNSNIGASTNVAGNLVLDGGTLRYTGAAVSTDRLFTITNNGGTIDASGAGALNFSNAGAIAYTTTNARSFTLTGSNTGDNTLRPILANNTGLTSLTKAGAGSWVLSGINTYTGTTTISAGILSISSDANLGTAPGSITANSITLSGGTLQATANLALNSNRGITLTANSGLAATSSNRLIYAGVITGGFDLTINGASQTGNISLTGSNSYTGATTISAGSLGIYKNDSIGGGTITLAGSTTLLLGRTVTSISNDIVLTGNATIAFDTAVDYLIVGGGGGGGDINDSGGGAGGGVIYVSGLAANGTTYVVTVGSGGTKGINGTASSFNEDVAAGGNSGLVNQTGGSSGANTVSTVGAISSVSYSGGLIGGNEGGGGAGAGSNGQQGTSSGGGSGGQGLYYGDKFPNFGESGWFASGGSGGGEEVAQLPPLGGGGMGGLNTIETQRNGQVNTGGGGGGNNDMTSSNTLRNAGSGGSGVVLVRYLGGDAAIGGTESTGTGTATGYRLHAFTSTGSSSLTFDSLAATFSGAISGSSLLTVNAAGGSIALSGTNTHNGGTTVSGGTVKAGSATAFGASSGAVVVAGGASLDLNGKTLINTNALTLNGTGVSAAGSLTNSSSSAGTYAGAITLGSISSIGSTSGAIAISGVISASSSNYGLALVGDKAITMSNASNSLRTIASGSSLGALTIVNTGDLTIGSVTAGLTTYTGLNSTGAISVKTTGDLNHFSECSHHQHISGCSNTGNALSCWI
jgi:autotransporter-associated beta strand protein